MDNFILNLIGELQKDKTKKNIEQQLKDISKELNIKIGSIDLNSRTAANEISQLKNNIEKSLGSVGTLVNKSAGEVNNLIHTLQTGIGSIAKKTYGSILSDLGLDDKSIKQATSQLENMKVRVDNISTSIKNVNKDGSGGKLLNVNITGTDELGRSVSLIQTFSKEEESVNTHTVRITENYTQQRAEIAKANKELEQQLSKVSAIQRRLNEIKATYSDRKNPLIGVEVDTENTGTSGNQTYLKTVESAADYVKEYVNAYNNAGVAIDSINQKLKTGQQITQSEIDNLNDLISKTDILGKNAKAKQTTATSFRSKDISSQVDVQREKLKKFTTDLEKSGISIDKIQVSVGDLNDALNNVGNDSNKFNEYLDMLEKANAKFQTLKSQIADVNNINNSFKQLQKLSSQKVFTNNSDSENVKELNSEVQKLEAKWKELNDEYEKTGITDSLYSGFKELSKNINVATDNANKLKTSLNSVADSSKLASDKSTFDNRITQWLNNNTKAGNNLKNTILAIQSQIENADRAKLTQLQQEFKKTTQYAIETGQAGKSLIDTALEKLGKFTSWFGVSNVVMYFVNDLKESLNTLEEVDSILTEISKTSDRSDKSLEELGENAFKVANTYGKTVQSYLTGVQEMSRAGYNDEKQSEGMAELAMLAEAAGDMTAQTAQDYLIATDAAYEYKGSIEQLNAVLDGQNMITNRNAVSMTDMAEATKESASIASQYGVKVEELSSLIAVATAKTREAGSETGNALKSIFINLQDTTNNEIVKTFDEVGVSMTEVVDGSEKLKTPIELLKELSDVFNSLDKGDTKRANILSNIGGKYRANTLAAILSDWDSYEKILNDYSEGAGSAQKEAEKTASNWESSVNRVKNSFTDLVQNFVDSNVVTNFFNLISDGIGTIDELTNSLGLAGTAFAAFMSYKGIKQGEDKMISSMDMPFLDYNNEFCA